MSVILYLIVCGTFLWISQRAKPLGAKPYRWGVYVGAYAAWTFVVLIASSVQAFGEGRLLGGLVLFIIAGGAGVASFGIIRRRRFGALAFGLSYAALLLITPMMEPVPNQPLLVSLQSKPPSWTEMAGQMKSFASLYSLTFSAVYLICTFVYFKKRWSLMGVTLPTGEAAARAASSAPPLR